MEFITPRPLTPEKIAAQTREFTRYDLSLIHIYRPAALPVGEKAGPMPFLLFTYRKFFLILSCLFISERCVGQ